MTEKLNSDEDFIELFEKKGATGTAKILKANVRGVNRRRRRLEIELGRRIHSPDLGVKTRTLYDHPARLVFDITDGQIIVGSDAHVWPHDRTTAQSAFIKFAKKLSPKIIVLNGDVLDGATISRHPSIGWEGKPSLAQEIQAVNEFLDDINKAAPNAKKVWTLGNHDARFETKMANSIPEFDGVVGTTLKEQFPYWHFCWSSFMNDDLVIKHRFKGGIHATHNNTMWSGRSIVTGHLHSLKVTPFTDYDGTRFGIDTGTLANPDGDQFLNYTEDNPKNWRSGFIVLTFKQGRLLWPEIAHVIAPGEIEFRGEVISV